MARPKYPSDDLAQFMVRMPPALRDRIKVYAERHGRSMNAEIVRILEREFPEPWPLADRVGYLAEHLEALQRGASNEKLAALLSDLEATIEGIVSGRVSGIDEGVREGVSWGYNRFLEERASYDPANAELDEEEHDQLGRTGTTAKFVDDPFAEDNDGDS